MSQSKTICVTLPGMSGEVDQIGTKEVALMMRITEATLRNYVWLQKLGIEERERRALQSPPKDMPLSHVIKGRIMWNAPEMHAWVGQWVAQHSRRKS